MEDLQEIYQHPFVKELVEQNQMMAEAMDDIETQTLSKKKVDLESIKIPYTIKNRLLFQEGTHNGLFYPYEHLEKNVDLWNDNDLFMAEHADASNAWIGLTKNARLVPEKKAIYGDLEIVDKNAAQKLAYQVLNKNGRMGISPTIDVDKQMVGNQMCALGPYNLKSQSVVLDPAVRTTMFNSKGGGTMPEENIQGGGNDPATQQLKKDEVAISKEELDRFKAERKELEQLKEKAIQEEVQELANLELEIGRGSEEDLSERKTELAKLSTQERKVLFDTYGWIRDELSDKTEEERFLSSMPEELKGKIPPGLKKYIEEKKKKKQENMSEEEEAELAKKKKYPYPEKMKGTMPDQKKKYPYPENPQKMGQDTQILSRETQQPFMKTSSNRFQELSRKNKEANSEFHDFLLMNQGDLPGGDRR